MRFSPDANRRHEYGGDDGEALQRQHGFKNALSCFDIFGLVALKRVLALTDAAVKQFFGT